MPNPATAKANPPVNLKFLQFHQPPLEDGEYQIEVTQNIKLTKNGKITTDEPFPTKTIKFYVTGERFALNPQDIHAVFPPAGSLGEHSNVLPHLILNRSTLPWERKVDQSSKDVPWLALLLFEEEEKPTPKILTLSQLKNDSKNPSKDAGKFPIVIGIDESLPSNQPFLKLEPGEQDNDKITVIDVQKSLLEKLLPTQSDLQYLAHVRQGTDNSDKTVGDEIAIIIGNRLPKKGGTSTVHLVSLEGRYNDNTFDYQNAEDNDPIRLVSLKSWRFACVDEKQSFKGLLKHLNKENNELNVYDGASILRLPPKEPTANPSPENPDPEDYLKMGYVPLPHYWRQGGKMISWYHSPLTTGENTTDITLPVRAADGLIRYNPTNGMFDVSYAAAWELGRLLALQNKGFSVSLYRWKRTHAQQLRKLEDQLIHAPSHLPVKGQQGDSTEIPDAIASWFDDLSLFKGVPFNYLVPDEKMLPLESIRFFWVDSLWVKCLLDGAYSIGRVTTSDWKRDSQHATPPAANPHDKVTGFLLRSDVVAGWPGLLVDGYFTVDDTGNVISTQLKPGKVPDSLWQEFNKQGLSLSKNCQIESESHDEWLIIANDNSRRYFIHKEDNKFYIKLPLLLLRMERLSANVLICLFEEEVQTVDIHQKPETLHFGLDFHISEQKFYKQLRDSNGVENLQSPKIDTIPWKGGEDNRVLDINGLATSIASVASKSSFTSAQFALQMIEGVERVRFKRE